MFNKLKDNTESSLYDEINITSVFKKTFDERRPVYVPFSSHDVFLGFIVVAHINDEKPSYDALVFFDHISLYVSQKLENIYQNNRFLNKENEENEENEKKIRLLKSLAGSVAHETRNPLASITKK